MINYYSIEDEDIVVNYQTDGIFNLLKALNIKYTVDTKNQNIIIPKFQKSENTDISDDNEIGHNNGGSTDYYKLLGMNDLQDIIENRNMNFAQGNILKAAFCFNVGRHEGTSYERELNKIIYFANRELQRIKKT